MTKGASAGAGKVSRREKSPGDFFGPGTAPTYAGSPKKSPGDFSLQPVAQEQVDDLGLVGVDQERAAEGVAGLARQVAKHNVAINNLLPGPFLTARQVDGLRKLAAKAGQDYETFLATRVAENPAGRFGTPEEFGKACAFLCSADAGFIIGQNLVIDGGSVNATI